MVPAKFLFQQLVDSAKEDKKKFYVNFFKTNKGQYGFGDEFLGVIVPVSRRIAKENYKNIELKEVLNLLHNKYHEARALALMIMVYKYNFTKDPKEKEQIFKMYLDNTKYINNWDLVDLSAKDIVGGHLFDKDRSILYTLAKSENMWENRIAIIATFYFIKENDFEDTIKISEILMNHPHHLIHKATGWMLREAGKHNEQVLLDFLDKYKNEMPRTMLSYALEKLRPKQKAFYMKKD